MPRSVTAGWRAIRASSDWSFSVTVARETWRPSSSPSQPCCRGFGDPCGQAVADEDQAGPLGGIDAEQGASFAGHLVDAACPVGAAAVTEGDLAPFEVAEELFPFGFGWRAVFLCRAQLAAARQERPVTGNDLLRVDRVVAHGGAEVLVAQDQLGRCAVAGRFCSASVVKILPMSWGVKVSGPAGDWPYGRPPSRCPRCAVLCSGG